jgi:hypothetical protein
LCHKELWEGYSCPIESSRRRITIKKSIYGLAKKLDLRTLSFQIAKKKTEIF